MLITVHMIQKVTFLLWIFSKGDNSQRQGDKRKQRSGICVVLGSADSAQGSGSSQQETGALLTTCN